MRRKRVTKRQFLSDVVQSDLEIEAHPTLDEVWLRVSNEYQSRGVIFRCSWRQAIEIQNAVSEAVGEVRGRELMHRGK